MPLKMCNSDAKRFAGSYLDMANKISDHLHSPANKAARSGAFAEIEKAYDAVCTALSAINKANGIQS